jgi:hypothetical protein
VHWVRLRVYGHGRARGRVWVHVGVSGCAWACLGARGRVWVRVWVCVHECVSVTERVSVSERLYMMVFRTRVVGSPGHGRVLCACATEGWHRVVDKVITSDVQLYSHATHHVCHPSPFFILMTQAALSCQPLPASEREALAAGLEALPVKQLEAALGLVLPRMAPGLLAGGVAGGGGGGGATANGNNGNSSSEVGGCHACGWQTVGGVGRDPEWWGKPAKKGDHAAVGSFGPGAAPHGTGTVGWWCGWQRRRWCHWQRQQQ